MTDTCKNITFLQTSFAGGKNVSALWIFYCFPLNVFVLSFSGYVMCSLSEPVKIHNTETNGAQQTILLTNSIYTDRLTFLVLVNVILLCAGGLSQQQYLCSETD